MKWLFKCCVKPLLSIGAVDLFWDNDFPAVLILYTVSARCLGSFPLLVRVFTLESPERKERYFTEIYSLFIWN